LAVQISAASIYTHCNIFSLLFIYMRAKHKIKLNILVSSNSISFTWAQHRRSFDSKQLILGVLALIVYPVLDRMAVAVKAFKFETLRTNRKFERRNIQNVVVCIIITIFQMSLKLTSHLTISICLILHCGARHSKAR